MGQVYHEKSSAMEPFRKRRTGRTPYTANRNRPLESRARGRLLISTKPATIIRRFLSAKRGAQRIADRSGAQVDVFSQTVERWTDGNGREREHVQKAFAVRVMPKRGNPRTGNVTLRALLRRMTPGQQADLIRSIDRFYYAAISEGFKPGEAQKFAEKRAVPEARKLVGRNPAGALLFRTRAAALKYAREHGAKRFSIKKLKRGR